jgi:hypothetical protein
MENTSVELEFGSEVLSARLFDTDIAKKFLQHLPVTVNLMQWGEEFYGGIGVDLGEENPVDDIPPGVHQQGELRVHFFRATAGLGRGAYRADCR